MTSPRFGQAERREVIVGAERTQEALFLGVGAREEDRLQGEAIRNDGRGHPTAGMSEFLHEETLIEETQATPAWTPPGR